MDNLFYAQIRSDLFGSGGALQVHYTTESRVFWLCSATAERNVYIFYLNVIRFIPEATSFSAISV